MQGYSISEEARHHLLLMKIRNYTVMFLSLVFSYIIMNKVARQILGKVGVLITFLVILAIAYLFSFIIIFAIRIVFPMGAGNLLVKKCNPGLALEVNHGEMRQYKNFNKMKEDKKFRFQYRTAAAYYYMGRPKDAIRALGEEYVNTKDLSPVLYFNYLNLLFHSYVAIRKVQDAKNLYDMMESYSHTMAVNEGIQNTIDQALEANYYEYQSIYFETIDKASMGKEYKQFLLDSIEGKKLIPLTRMVLYYDLAQTFRYEEDFVSAIQYYNMASGYGANLYIAKQSKQWVETLKNWNPNIVKLTTERMDEVVEFYKKEYNSSEMEEFVDYIKDRIVLLYQKNFQLEGIVAIDPVSCEVEEVIVTKGVQGDIAEKQLLDTAEKYKNLVLIPDALEKCGIGSIG